MWLVPGISLSRFFPFSFRLFFSLSKFFLFFSPFRPTTNYSTNHSKLFDTAALKLQWSRHFRHWQSYGSILSLRSPSLQTCRMLLFAWDRLISTIHEKGLAECIANGDASGECQRACVVGFQGKETVIELS